MSSLVNPSGSPLGNQPTKKVKLDLSQTSKFVCEKCSSQFFHMVYMFRKVSALISPTGEESILPMQTFACLNCGNVSKEFIPSELNDLHDENNI